jgi:hypothetical protein
MALTALTAALIGRPFTPPPALLDAFPELRTVRWRLGGLPPRLGGWFLARRTVAAITFWDTVFVAPEARISAELLLHEFAHVRQFAGSPAFPVRYLWDAVRRGYYMNRFEVDARTYAADRVQRASTSAAQAVPRA